MMMMINLRLCVGAIALGLLLMLSVRPELSANANKVIRVKLFKGTTMQAGFQGQPITSYYAKVDVGTPPKTFNMGIDIDAKETWLPHYSMLGGLIYNRLHYKSGYAKKQSSSSVKNDLSYTFDHMFCKLEGKAYEDVFELKNLMESFNRPIARQRFLAISSASNDRFANMPIDGVIAFNSQLDSPTGTRSMLSELLRAKLIDEAKFSLWLDSDSDSADGGELTIGGINPSRYVGIMIKHPMVASNTTDRWALELKEVSLGDNVISCYHKNCRASLSTGVNDLYGPREDVKRIIDGLRSLKGGIKIERSATNEDLYELDCLRVVDLPPLKFVIGDIPYQIPAKSYVNNKVSGNLLFKSAGCYLAIMPNDSSSKEWILGSNFLSNFYTVYDQAKREIGIATRTEKTHTQ